MCIDHVVSFLGLLTRRRMPNVDDVERGAEEADDEKKQQLGLCSQDKHEVRGRDSSGCGILHRRVCVWRVEKGGRNLCLPRASN